LLFHNFEILFNLVFLLAFVIVEFSVFDEAFLSAVSDLFALAFHCERFVCVAELAFSVPQDLDGLVVEGELIAGFADEFGDNEVFRRYFSVVEFEVHHAF